MFKINTVICRALCCVLPVVNKQNVLENKLHLQWRGFHLFKLILSLLFIYFYLFNRIFH